MASSKRITLVVAGSDRRQLTKPASRFVLVTMPSEVTSQVRSNRGTKKGCEAGLSNKSKIISIDIRTPDTGTGVAQGQSHYAWRGDDAQPKTKRERARRRYALGPCELCGKRGIERHHFDGDTGNNAASNIKILCRRCHMLSDGRLDAFIELGRSSGARQSKPSRECRICGRVSPPKRMWKDRCHRCNEFWRRNGIDRTAGDDREPGVSGERHGKAHGKAKLTVEAIREIRNGTGTHESIAVRYGVSRSTVSLIKAGRLWKSC